VKIVDSFVCFSVKNRPKITLKYTNVIE